MPTVPEPPARLGAAPTHVGPWRLVRALGAGAFGTAWRAEDGTGRVAVVKLLSEPPGDEVRALSRVSHPAVVRLLDAGAVPVPYLVMTLAPGSPLAVRLEEGSLDVSAAFPLVARLASALAACHLASVTHGDVKPDNVLVDEEGKRATLIDFGLSGGRGGTPRYAAPEVLGGSPSGAPSDVYSLGLMAWELSHGEVPDADQDWLLVMEQRGRQAPTPTEGPGWWRDLLVAMLQPEPSARPSAAAVADALAVQGFVVPPPSVAELALRAGTLAVPIPAVTGAWRQWVEGSGVLAVVGPDGAGKSHALEHAGLELRARGEPFVTLGPTGRPWASVEEALSDPALRGASAALPDGADTISRARAAAEVLVKRAPDGLRVIVDDLDRLDEGSRRTVQELARLGAAVLLSANEAPSWAPTVADLVPLDPAQGQELLGALLGTVDETVLEEQVRRRVGAWPADYVHFALEAVEKRALVFRHGRWIIDEPQLESLDVATLGRRLVVPDDLPEDSLRLGALIGMLQPVPLRWALETAGVREQALEPLRTLGWVRGRRRLSCVTLRVAQTLRDAVVEPERLWASAVQCLREEEPEPSALLGWALVGAKDRTGIARDGPAAIAAALELDVRDAAQLAVELHTLCPTAEILAARIDACVQAGRTDEARAEGEAWLHGRHPEPQDLVILLALARLEDAVTEDAEAILGWTTRAREALGGRPSPASLDLVEARARFRSGELAVAEAMCAAHCEVLPAPGHEAEWLTARGLLAQIQAELYRPDVGLASLDVDPAVGSGTRARALFEGVRGRLLWMSGRPRQAATVLQAAAAQRHALSTVDQARMENNAGLCWYVAGDVERAVAGWERALIAFEALSADIEVLRVLVNLCVGFCDLGRWGRSVAVGERAVSMAQALSTSDYEAVALGNLGDVAMWRRRYREAEELYDRYDALLPEAGEARVELARRRAELAAHRLATDAGDLAQRAVDAATEHEQPTERGRSLAVRAVTLAREGHRARAEADIEESIRVLRASDATGELAIARLWVAEALLALRMFDPARRHAAEVMHYAEEFGRAPLRSWADDLVRWSRSTTHEDPRRLELLTELSVRVSSQVNLSDVLDELARAAVELIDAERAFVVLVEEDDLRVAARAGDELPDALPSSSVVRRALALGREIVVTDLESRADLQRAESVVAMELKAVMCAPLFLDGVVSGVLYLDSRQTPMASLSEAVSLVRSLAAHASVSLSHARLTDQVRTQIQRAREVAHDLKNPLGGVLMMLEDVADGYESMSAADARRATGDLRHALDMVHSSLSAGDAEPVSFPWASAVANWARSLELQARARGVRLQIESDGAGARAVGRPMDLRRAVANLVGNAIKYTPPGGVVLVTTFADVASVGVHVDDEGPGIPDADLERIFESGVQAAGAVAGHGLGLSIARRVCREHGGDVTAERRATGSRFALWVSRAE